MVRRFGHCRETPVIRHRITFRSIGLGLIQSNYVSYQNENLKFCNISLLQTVFPDTLFSLEIPLLNHNP